MTGYDPRFWIYGENITAGQFCEYMKENIPPDAILHVCGSSQIYLHFSADKKVFSLDDGALSEYGNCEVGEFK